MYFTDISYVVHPVGRVTPNGVTLLGTAFFINRRGLLRKLTLLLMFVF